MVITVYATSSPTASGNDYAELYPVANPDIGAGNIVSVDSTSPVQMRLALQDDKTLAGVISTAPGQILGDQNATGERPVALSGRVPVYVNLDGGPINVGDRIAVSTVPGIGMKAGPFDDSVGIAMTSYDGSESDGQVTVFLDIQRAVDIDEIAFTLLDQNPSYFGLAASSTEATLSTGPLDFVGAMMNAIASRLTSFAGISSSATSTTATTTASGFSLYQTIAALSGQTAASAISATSSQSALAALSVSLVHATTTSLTTTNATSGIITTAAPAAYALVAQRYMHEYGVLPEHLAAIAVTQRGHAALHPHAHMRTPITVDDVMNSRMISTPLKLLDCCLVSDGAAAVIVSAPENVSATADGIALPGSGQGHTHEHISAAPSLIHFGCAQSAQQAFARAGMAVSDIDVAEIYDSFTITLAVELESMGFFGKGEAGPAAAAGELGLTGRLPCNTHGGLLSYGHSGAAGGMFHVVEAVNQLKHRAGGRQVDGAEVALVHGDGGILSAHCSLILGRVH